MIWYDFLIYMTENSIIITDKIVIVLLICAIKVLSNHSDDTS